MGHRDSLTSTQGDACAKALGTRTESHPKAVQLCSPQHQGPGKQTRCFSLFSYRPKGLVDMWMAALFPCLEGDLTFQFLLVQIWHQHSGNLLFDRNDRPVSWLIPCPPEKKFRRSKKTSWCVKVVERMLGRAEGETGCYANRKLDRRERVIFST